jgi:ATP-dependent RNA helicase DHX8/PRP22
VVDTGVAKEKEFDPVKNVSSLRIKSISQSSAKQRAGRAGRTQPGICHRLYSQAAFSLMRPSSLPEIKSMQLGQTLLKLLTLGISNPDQFDYIESPGQDNILSAMKELVALGAVTSTTTADYQLTELGGRMARLPVVPRLAKLLLVACAEGLGGDALIVSALASLSGSVFFRGGSVDDIQAADQQKIQFCSELGDFITLLELFKTWAAVPVNNKSAWCVTNSINAKSMRTACEAMKDIKAALQKDVGLRIQERRDPSTQEEHVRLMAILFDCFRDNLCMYSGHPKTGYINLRTRDASRLHPSTCFLYLNNITPQLIVYDQVTLVNFMFF